MSSILIRDIFTAVYFDVIMNTILFKTFTPEIFFSLSILLQILFNTNLVVSYKLNFPLLNKEVLSQVFFILLSLLILYFNLKIDSISFNFIFANTSSEYFIKIFFIGICLSTLISIWRSFLIQKLNFFEFFVVFLISVFSLLLLLNTFSLVSVYLLIELQALCFYILSCFTRNSSFSTEAGLKYFISGAFISGFFLFGCSLLYGSLGTLNLNLISLLLSFPITNNLNFIVVVGIFLITITFLFKISAVPFHFWSPDVYEGAPLSSTIVFSIIPKLVLFTFLIKWCSSLSSFFILTQHLFVFTGLSSVFIGTFFAIQQKRIKRIVIFSSIAQLGFLLLGISTNTVTGFSSVYFFLIIYLFTSILVWNFLSLFYNFQKKINQFNKGFLMSLYLSNLSNFFDHNKLFALVLTFIFYSLGGIPPFIGFFSKLFILYALTEVNSYFTIFLLLFISVISVFYYVRFIKILFFEKKTIHFMNIKYQTLISDNYIYVDVLNLTILLFLLIYLFFYPNLLLLITQFFVLSNVIV